MRLSPRSCRFHARQVSAGVHPARREYSPQAGLQRSKRGGRKTASGLVSATPACLGKAWMQAPASGPKPTDMSGTAIGHPKQVPPKQVAQCAEDSPSRQSPLSCPRATSGVGSAAKAFARNTTSLGIAFHPVLPCLASLRAAPGTCAYAWGTSAAKVRKNTTATAKRAAPSALPSTSRSNHDRVSMAQPALLAGHNLPFGGTGH